MPVGHDNTKNVYTKTWRTMNVYQYQLDSKCQEKRFLDLMMTLIESQNAPIEGSQIRVHLRSVLSECTTLSGNCAASIESHNLVSSPRTNTCLVDNHAFLQLGHHSMPLWEKAATIS